jgi:aminopeptidase-like protein
MKSNKVFSILILSSLIFITNVLSTLYKKYYFYSFLFACLTITSLIFHYNNNIYTNILDKIFILAIVLYGGNMLYNKTTSDNKLNVLLIITSFLSCIFLFFYGYCVKDYCYNPNKYIANKYHCMIHIIGSIGHHLITFL